MGAGKKYKVIFLRRSFFTFALREESAHTRREKSARALSRNECVFGELKIVMVENISLRHSPPPTFSFKAGPRLAVKFEIYGRFI
jgi:hypothetical protein